MSIFDMVFYVTGMKKPRWCGAAFGVGGVLRGGFLGAGFLP